MKGLINKRIGIAAERQAEAISTLITKQGGTAEVFSIQGEWILNDDICVENVKKLIHGSFPWVVLTTGIGAKSLEDAAIRINEREAFLQALRNTKIAIRGSKTLNWLRQHDLKPLYVAEDGTMENLLSFFQDGEKREGQENIYIQLYDQDDQVLQTSFEQLGFAPYLSKPYHYKHPDTQVLQDLKDNILQSSLDAVVFTSKTQVRNLFQQTEQNEALTRSFNEHVLAVAVGKVTASELERQGIKKVIQPANQKMGEMIVKLSEYYISKEW
ncbi:uroporphyrinogen-III synthase [Heyndrickxia ginsengihumi]|uniref:Uroporphyrinogen-III synthase n=1 Tax=Heyndrickxia ginsengihumi TaxID=363870 RepID=A0A0A6VGA3_9BACI|nr:uroporphyrinogen-III synthase [Heyndrickxia ginsengihumi]KHD86611.1 hypothetical protein NG54_01955 [Heyndrickxia ginsengihumi]MBE6185277.1 uroporphyrinogen-III synthase [Bacillus sp. (in: firmicutes)]MCM3022647.1 uroporphyrinogen-III synthase [Heyndrickxia ginsengihumi]NEY19014.1 uroporphyrinogen-III synthase [Heyndrickxia ginsengihumi]